MRGFSPRSSLSCILCGCLFLTVQSCDKLEPEEPPSIVLITIDTLRADHLSTYDYFRQTSPTLDAFAREATVFENVSTTMATTLPAHASLMTSTWTTTHGIKGNFQHLGGALDDETGLRTMAEILNDLDYQTAAFVSAAPVRAHTGMQRGFATFDQPAPHQRRADATTDRALAWLESASRRPFFLWIHFFDPHRPRQPPEPFDRAFTSDGALVDFLQERGVGRARDRHLQNQINAYDGEILFTDTQIRRIFEALKNRGEWPNSAVVVTADHGEGLGQHGWMDHGKIYNEQLFVPLIVKFPAGQGPRSARIPTTASLIDLLPTLAAALELPVSDRDRAQFEGIDLLAGDVGRPGVLSERSHRMKKRGLQYSLMNAEWKYFYSTQAEDELYDLVADPHEKVDVLEQHPEVAERMRDEILRTLAESRHDSRGRPEADLDEEVVRQLEALGYLRGGAEDEPAEVFEGMAVWGHEVREFRPCGSDTVLWVHDASGEFGEKYRESTSQMTPSTEVYMEVAGERAPPPLEGFGATLGGTLRVTRVLSVDPSLSGCGGS